jgi:hypothetical protein
MRDTAIPFIQPFHTALLCILFFSLPYPSALAQSSEMANKPDTATQKVHSPKKAAVFSAVLPGLGQAYNHKYWKIPIVYVGFGAFGYFIHQNYTEYQKFKEAYIWKVSNDTVPINNEYIYKYESADQLKSGKDYYLRNFELTCILTGLWYILNILDATVDAYLMDYEINENLSLHIEPGIARQDLAARQPVMGFTLTLHFR